MILNFLVQSLTNVICKNTILSVIKKLTLISNSSMVWGTTFYMRVVFTSETESNTTLVTYILVLLKVILIIMFLCTSFSVVSFVTVDIRARVWFFSDQAPFLVLLQVSFVLIIMRTCITVIFPGIC